MIDTTLIQLIVDSYIIYIFLVSIYICFVWCWV